MSGDGPDTPRMRRPTGSDDRPESSLGSAETTAGRGESPAPTRPAEPPAPPRRIGRYVVIKTLGRGGMGVVYQVRDERDGREVALKVIPAGPDADPDELARFRAEAEVAARLNHPNIVRVFEIGEKDHAAYIAMEYIPGGNLYKRVAGGKAVPPNEAARLVEQIARAAHYAHERGVIHRDLKPSNILLAPRGAGQPGPWIGEAPTPLSPKPEPTTWDVEPKIADFGLAKQLNRSLGLTQSGVALGTPNYMAPEQAQGDKAAIGPPADIHALGGILYELLVGFPPFGGGSPLETMDQVVNKKPVPPSHLRNGIPPELEAICLKCLEKSPSKRYRTAAELANALSHYLTGPNEPTVRIRPSESSSRGPRWPIVVGAAVIAAIIASAVGFLAGRSDKLRGRPDNATDQDAMARAERRARLEAAVALCEGGVISHGLEQMRALEAQATADGLPVRQIIAAWDARVPKRTAELHNVRATVAAMTPRGALLATADGDLVQVWQTADWSRPQLEWKVDGPVTAIGWSEDEAQLAVGTVSGKVYVKNTPVAGASAQMPIDRPGSPVVAVAFAFPGVRAVFGGDVLRQEFAARLPPARPGDTNRFDLDAGPVTTAAVAPVSGDVAAVTGTGAIRIFDAGEARWRDLPPDGDASAVAFSADGNVLAVGTRSGTVRLWDAAARAPLTEAVVLGKRVAALAVRETEKDYLVVALPEAGPAIVIQCGRPFVAPPIRLRNRPGSEVLGVAFSGDGANLFVTSPYGVSRWRVRDAKRYGPDRDFSSGDQYGQPASAHARYSAGTVQVNGGRPESILVGGSRGRLFLVDGDAGRTIREPIGTSGAEEVTAVAVGRDGQAASASRTEKATAMVRHWSGGMDGQPQAREFACDVHQEAFLPDASAVVLACGDNRVRVWDPTTDTVRAELNCGSPVLAVAVDSDGSQILAGCADGTAHLWDLTERKELLVVRHRAEVRAVAFHKDSLLTASADGTARIWHAGTGLSLGPPMRHPDAISAMAVWGDLVATGGRGRYVRVWRLP